MNTIVRPIADMQLFPGKVLFTTIVTSMNGQDPAFGSLSKEEVAYAAVTRARIINSGFGEDMKSFILDLQRVNENNEPLNPDDLESNIIKGIRIPHDQSGMSLKEGIWSDQEDAVKDICDKLNREQLSRINGFIDKFIAKRDFINQLINEGA